MRDQPAGYEVLLVQRNQQLSFHGGAWVFPGGRIDPQDYANSQNDVLAAAKRAAVREVWEEAGVRVDADDLVLISRWITPEGQPKRFDTWFFAARAEDEPVCIDGEEIHAHRWLQPALAVEMQARGELVLPPPTFVTLVQLNKAAEVNAMLEFLKAGPIDTYRPRLCLLPGGACTLYVGDAGYDANDPDVRGPRHRLWMLESGWRYERTT
jgi:8-oxo-dGTP pyrophosphatase MutT (NUDIX family)